MMSQRPMRFWITKNSELPIREQLVRQVLLGILSEDLPAGHKLPSVPALARRHRIHSNTVSAAYHDLLQQGWLELRRGSGLYVRQPQSSADDRGLDKLLTTLLQSAQSLGHEPEEVLQRLEHLARPRTCENILIAEPEPAMREILQAELAEHLTIPIEAAANATFHDPARTSRTLVVALPTRAANIFRTLPKEVSCTTLRIRSVPQSLEGHARPPANTVISIVSGSPEIRHWARAMLIAVGLDADSLCEIDTAGPDWRDRIGNGAFIVCDVVTARDLPSTSHTEVFRVIADSSLAELKQFCGA